jgi:hypothetical protein
MRRPGVLAFLMLLPGLALVLVGAVQLALGRAEVARFDGWSSVPGTVRSAGYEIVDTWTRYGASWHYRPVLRYRYTVGGAAQKGDTAWLGWQPRLRSEAEVEALLADFPEGLAVTVRHDPADPARSALFAAVDYGGGLAIVIPGLVLLAGGVLLALALRSAPRRRG